MNKTDQRLLLRKKKKKIMRSPVHRMSQKPSKIHLTPPSLGYSQSHQYRELVSIFTRVTCTLSTGSSSKFLIPSEVFQHLFGCTTTSLLLDNFSNSHIRQKNGWSVTRDYFHTIFLPP